MNLFARDLHSDIYEIGILTLESGIYRSWRSSLSAYR